MIKNNYIANSKEQDLIMHTTAIVKKSLEIIESYNLDEKVKNDIINIAYYSAILHDIGKVSCGFQKYLKSKIRKKSGYATVVDEYDITDAEKERDKKPFKGPFHNEISFYFSAKHMNFYDDIIHRSINYVVYYHHPANCDEKRKFVFDKTDEIQAGIEEDNIIDEMKTIYKEIVLKVNNSKFFKSYKHFINTNEVSRCVDRPDFVGVKFKTKERAIKRLSLAILMEADRYVSAMESTKLDDYINEEIFHNIENIKQIFKIKEIDKSDKRSLEQMKLVNEILKNKISICAVDTGAGKTSISLLSHFMNNKNKVIFALPKQAQVTALFETVQNDILRILDSTEGVSIEGIYGGKIQHSYPSENKFNEKMLTSDINILVFDRLLSPCYEGRQFNELLCSFRSDLIIDEFHEFAWIPAMIEPLREIIQIREWINNGTKTIFLSGTPDPALVRILFGNNPKIFDRNYLPPVNNTKTNIIYKDLKLAEITEIKGDTLFSFNTIDNAQKFLLNELVDMNNTILIHSKFTDNDRAELTNTVLKTHSRNQTKKITVTAKLLQSSFNLNFENLYQSISHPCTNAQTIGRVNRFDNKPNGRITIMPEEKLEIFFDNKLGFKGIITEWCTFLKKELHQEQQYTIREMLVNLFDKFWENNERVNRYHKYVETQANKAFIKLSEGDWFPIRLDYKPSKNKIKNVSTLKSKKIRFRGISKFLSAAIISDEGQITGQLSKENLLSVSSAWEIEKLRIATKNFSNSVLAKNFHPQFEYNKYTKNFGSSNLTPLLTSIHISNNENLAKLRIEDDLTSENENLYRVYHNKFGLIKKNLFDGLVNKLKKK